MVMNLTAISHDSSMSGRFPVDLCSYCTCEHVFSFPLVTLWTLVRSVRGPSKSCDPPSKICVKNLILLQKDRLPNSKRLRNCSNGDRRRSSPRWTSNNQDSISEAQSTANLLVSTYLISHRNSLTTVILPLYNALSTVKLLCSSVS